MCLHGPSRVVRIYGRGRLGAVQKAKLGLQPCQPTVQPGTRSPPSRRCPRWAMPENSEPILSVQPCTRASTKQGAHKDRARRGGCEIRSPGSPDRSLALFVGRIVCSRRAGRAQHRAVRGFATSARLPLKLGRLQRSVAVPAWVAPAVARRPRRSRREAASRHACACIGVRVGQPVCRPVESVTTSVVSSCIPLVPHFTSHNPGHSSQELHPVLRQILTRSNMRACQC